MLMPRTYAWTRKQKWLIVAATVASLFAVSVLIYHYERDGRPSERLFYGAWQGVSEGTGDGVVWRFGSDHTFSSFVLSPMTGEKLPLWEGRWFAGGPFLYLRPSPQLNWRDMVVLRFAVSPDHLTINLPHSRETLWSLERLQ